MARRDASALHGDEHVRAYRDTDGEYGHDWRNSSSTWYLNLRAEPEVDVQVLDERFRARARDATPEEKPALWREMVSHWPRYDDYQRRTSRQIPVVVLERI